jgi:hypothetical protein
LLGFLRSDWYSAHPKEPVTVSLRCLFLDSIS